MENIVDIIFWTIAIAIILGSVIVFLSIGFAFGDKTDIYEDNEGNLNILAKLIGMTYNEINIIVYYLIIPLSWCIMLDYIIGLPITTPLWILLWVYIFWSKRKFFKEWCDVAFKLSVDFLLKFQRIGWNYWVASVIIGVVVPIIVYVVLILLIISA